VTGYRHRVSEPERSLVIIGAGGHGRELLDLVEAVSAAPGRPSRYRFLGYLDDGPPDLDLLARRGANLLGGLRELAQLDADYLIGVTGAPGRARVDGIASAAGRRPATLVHPTASVGGDVRLGPGTVVCALACLTTNVRTGRHVIVNVGASVGHDCQVDDYAVLAAGARLSGGVSVGAGAWIDTSASVVEARTVGAGSVVCAGSAVLDDVPPGLVVSGVPARPVQDAPDAVAPVAAYAIPGRRDGSAGSPPPSGGGSLRSSRGSLGGADRV
jgi:sugar O-acyltransferase (sialic acid O-acetyltransferase NeuD family)